MKIIIRTLNRKDNQITYNNLPEKYQNNVIFVVREHEFDFFCLKYGEGKVLLLPNDTKNITDTTNFILNHFNEKILICDDDLKFINKTYTMINNKPKWHKLDINNNEEHFDILFNKLNTLSETYIHGGLSHACIKPSIKCYPINYNYRNSTHVYIDCSKLPKDIRYRIDGVEDFDLTLQLLSKGYQNFTLTDYIVSEKSYAKGGCDLYRTLEYHNESCRKLQKQWPEYVKLREKTLKTPKAWKGKIQLKTTIQWKKAIKYGINNNKLK
jgi:hypothetical protein